MPPQKSHPMIQWDRGEGWGRGWGDSPVLRGLAVSHGALGSRRDPYLMMHLGRRPCPIAL